MKISLFVASILFATFAQVAILNARTIAHCSGYTLPNGVALSFDYVQDPLTTGSSKSEIHCFSRDTHKAGAQDIPLAQEICETERVQAGKTICVNGMSEIYSFDSKNKSAVESGDGYKIKYKCDFF